MPDFDPKHSYALVVGIGRYDAPELPPLHGPVPDALDFTAWLLKRGVPPKHIKLFLSRTTQNPKAQQPDPKDDPRLNDPKDVEVLDATRNNIDTVLRGYFAEKQANPRTLLWIFWGGHGVMQPDGTVRLFYQDATSRDKKNLDLDALLRLLRTNFYERDMWSRQIVVVDACRTFASHLAWRHGLPSEDYGLHREEAGREQFVLFAARPGEYAEEAPTSDGDNSGFLSRLVQAKLPADPAAPWPPDMPEITTQIIAQFEKLRAAGRVSQTPTFLHTRDWNGSIRTRRDSAHREPPPSAFPAPDSTRQALARELCVLAEFATPEKRSRLIASLQLDSVPWSDDAAEHAALIVEACDRVDWGYATLLDALDARGSPDLPGFVVKLDSLVPLGAMEWDRLLELLRLIRKGLNVAPAEAARALRRFGRVPVGSAGQLFLHSIAQLARLPLIEDNRSHPLFRFLAECRHNLPAGTKAEFDAWEKAAAEYLDIDLAAIRAVVARDAKARDENLRRPSPAGLEPAVLHIRIAPAEKRRDALTGVETSTHLVAAWLKGPWLEGQLAVLLPEQPFPSEEFPVTIKKLVASAFAQIEASVQPKRTMWIHLFLPLDLIDAALDEIELPRGNLGREQLGRRHPVLARSYDRFYRGAFQSIRADLRDHWPKGGQSLAPAEISWHCSCPTRTSVANGHFQTGKKALVAFDLPAAPISPDEPTLLAYLQDSPLPFAVILRAHTGDAANTRQNIETQLLNQDPLTWPAQLPGIRTQAPAQFQCSGFTLLWDDPNEVPPDVNYELQVP